MQSHPPVRPVRTGALKRVSHVVVASGALAIGLAGGFTAAFASGGFERPTEINNGLVNAANSVLQNLLGNDVASIHGFNPQPDPPRLMMHLNLDSAIATDVVIFSKAQASSTCQNVARISIGNGTITLTLTRDTGAAIELETDNLNLGGLPPGPTCQLEADTR